LKRQPNFHPSDIRCAINLALGLFQRHIKIGGAYSDYLAISTVTRQEDPSVVKPLWTIFVL
jgi:hypothetical protein